MYVFEQAAAGYANAVASTTRSNFISENKITVKSQRVLPNNDEEPRIQIPQNKVHDREIRRLATENRLGDWELPRMKYTNFSIEVIPLITSTERSSRAADDDTRVRRRPRGQTHER